MGLPYPSLRHGLVGAWCPSLGASGLKLIDRSGRNNHGTLVNMDGQDNWRASGSGVALNLDGSNDHAVVPGPVPTSSIAVSSWVNLRSQPSASNLAGIFSRWGNNSAFDATDAFTLNIGVGQGFRFFLGGVNAGATTGASAVTLSKWTHLAATYDRATITIFVDGTARGSTAASGLITQSTVEMRIGKDVSSNASDRNLDGLVDDVRIYSRALTLAEIRLLASRRGIGLTPPPLFDDDSDLCNYPLPSTANRVHANVDGVWLPGQVRANESGAWGNGAVAVNQGGVWPAREYHPESLFWKSRVESGGGTVSDATLDAVSTFCSAIDAAGIRDRFARLNLFCGTGLSACLTPLYLSSSFQGAELGNATDTNFNFVDGDYVETGAGGGLQGNGTTKYLNCGASILSQLSVGNAHLSVSGASLNGVSSVNLIGAGGPAFNSLAALQTTPGGTTHRAFINGTPTAFADTSTAFSSGHLIGSSVATNDLRLFQNGTQNGSTLGNTRSGSLTANAVFVFAYNDNGTPSPRIPSRLQSYSIGLGLNAAQAAAFSAAVIAFNAALGRS